MADRFWRYDNPEHRALFGTLLAPLVTAAGSLEIRQWRDEAYSRAQLKTWILMLGDVPEDILREAIDRVVMQGVTWMPRPGDVKAKCADVVDERRRIAAKRAEQLSQDCERCSGTKYEPFIDAAGVSRVKRCWCFTRGLELIAEAGQPIARPQIAERSEVDA